MIAALDEKVCGKIVVSICSKIKLFVQSSINPRRHTRELKTCVHSFLFRYEIEVSDELHVPAVVTPAEGISVPSGGVLE